MAVSRVVILCLMNTLLLQNGAEAFFFWTLPNNFSFSFNVTYSRSSSVNLTITNLIGNIRQAAITAEQEANNIGETMERTLIQSLNIIGLNLTNGIQIQANLSESQIQTALNNGLAVENCSRTEEFEAILNETRQALSNCVTNKIQQGTTLIDNLINNRNTANNLSNVVTQEYRNCVGQINFVTPAILNCKLNIAATYGPQFTQLGVDLARNVAAGAAYLGTLKIDLATCGFLASADGASRATELAAEVSQCIEDSQ